MDQLLCDDVRYTLLRTIPIKKHIIYESLGGSEALLRNAKASQETVAQERPSFLVGAPGCFATGEPFLREKEVRRSFGSNRGYHDTVVHFSNPKYAIILSDIDSYSCAGVFRSLHFVIAKRGFIHQGYRSTTSVPRPLGV
jgi:hypothetical protein